MFQFWLKYMHTSKISFLTICEAGSVQSCSRHQGVLGVEGSAMQQVILQVAPQHKQTGLNHI